MKLQNIKLQNIINRLGLGEKPLLEELAPANGVSLLGALTGIALPDDGLPGGTQTFRRMLLDPQDRIKHVEHPEKKGMDQRKQSTPTHSPP